MPLENSAGLGVNNQYGPRQTAEGRAGAINTFGIEKELELDFRGSDYQHVTAKLPRGAKFIRAIAFVEEAFALGGTNPTINVGTSGSVGTNYAIELTEAQAEAANTTVFNQTGAGTWANPLAADTVLAVGLDGTNPTISGGKAKIVISYIIAEHSVAAE